MALSKYTSSYCSAEMVLPEYIETDRLGSRLANHQKALHGHKISETELKETLRYYYESIEWAVSYTIIIANNFDAAELCHILNNHISATRKIN